jgi:putative flippase GtrA
MRWRAHIWTLVKSSVGSIVCVFVELSLLELLSRLGVPLAICFGAIQIIGTMITFTFNKYWAFGAARTGRLVAEGTKSVAVFGGSLVLNTALPSLLSYGCHAAPVVAYLVSQVLVYIAWNFPLNRWWVFREQQQR